MKRIASLALALFFSLSFVNAQNLKDNGGDVPAVKSDSTRRMAMPYVSYPAISAGKMPDFLIFPEDGVETKEERALRINRYAFEHTMESVSHFLYGKPIIVNRDLWRIQNGQRSTVFYFWNPFAIPFGYVPLMNSSNPFVTALIPGWAPDPDADKYSPDKFPQQIELEYDFSTGTYKQAYVKQKGLEDKMTFGASGNSGSKPVPDIPVTPVERRMRGM